MTAVCIDCGQRINPDAEADRCLTCEAEHAAENDDCSREGTHTDIDVLEREAKACGCDDCRHIVRYINGQTR